MGRFDGAEVSELIGIYILCFLAKLINKNDCGLYRDDELLLLRNVNGQQIDRMCKNITEIFKDIGFAIDVESNLKIVDLLDITFDLNNSTYRPCKKPSELLSYINISSNHTPQIVNKLPKQSMNVYPEIPPMNKSLIHQNQHEKALRDSGYTDFELKFYKSSTNQTKRNQQRNIIWFNPPFSKAVSTNVGKRFLQLLHHHFPSSN